MLGRIPGTAESRAIAEIASATDKSKRWLMVRNFGHRAALDYELAEPRYAEDINSMARLIDRRYAGLQVPVGEHDSIPKSLRGIVDVARRFQTLKEDAKHHTLLELAFLRRVVLSIDRRLAFDQAAFYLTIDELLSLDTSNAQMLRELAGTRRQDAEILRSVASLPATLTVQDLEVASTGGALQTPAPSHAIQGARVSGSKPVEGRARVVNEEDAEHGKPIEEFRDGDIIVTTMVNPAWLPYFSRAGAFVSEVGGWLSHPAILAREYNLAMLVGVENISRIADGDILRINLDGTIDVIRKAELCDHVAAA
jgi:phosphohistidine swiveling domain-containing protein